MKFEEKDDQFREKLDKVNERFECLENVAGKGSQVNAQKIESLGDNFVSIESRFEEISHVMDNVLDRLHEFEAQRKNNLIFYGVPEENNESSVKLLGKVREVIRSQFGVQVSSDQTFLMQINQTSNTNLLHHSILRKFIKMSVYFKGVVINIMFLVKYNV